MLVTNATRLGSTGSVLPRALRLPASQSSLATCLAVLSILNNDSITVTHCQRLDAMIISVWPKYGTFLSTCSLECILSKQLCRRMGNLRQLYVTAWVDTFVLYGAKIL